MTQHESAAAPVRGDQHQALAVFLRRWRAKGQSFGGANQRADDPRSAAEAWVSSNTGKWHTGEAPGESGP